MKMTPASTPFLVACEACGIPGAIYGTIKLGIYDPMHRYKSSRRKMITNYRWRLCPKHYKETLEKIKKAVEGI